MKKNYIIDGFNVGFAVEEIASHIKHGHTDLAIEKIIQFVKSHLKKNTGQIIIVFDGQDSARKTCMNRPGVEIRFSRKPQTADDIIREFVRSTSDIKNWCVISSDNEILFTSRDHGAKTLTAQNFIRTTRLSQQNQQSKNPKKYDARNIDVEYWKQLFENRDQNNK